MKALFQSLFIMICLSACAANHTKIPNDVVKVSQPYSGTQPQVLDTERADRQALEICRDRGFTGAEQLGTEQQVCAKYTGWYQCFYHEIEQQYQCTNH
jgi:hypothetical protein